LGGKSRVAGFFTRPESFVTSVRCRVGFCFVRRTRARFAFISHLSPEFRPQITALRILINGTGSKI
jgi:hypothetical protein